MTPEVAPPGTAKTIDSLMEPPAFVVPLPTRTPPVPGEPQKTWTEVLGAKPLPVTVTFVPAAPELGASVTTGPYVWAVARNVAPLKPPSVKIRPSSPTTLATLSAGAIALTVVHVP